VSSEGHCIERENGVLDVVGRAHPTRLVKTSEVVNVLTTQISGGAFCYSLDLVL